MKKSKNKNPITEKNELDIVINGSSGLHLNAKNDIDKAKFQLEKVKEIELEKIEKGFIWVKKEKTSKLIHPSKLKMYKTDGWNKLKTNKKQ
jgi:hypothetical protein